MEFTCEAVATCKLGTTVGCDLLVTDGSSYPTFTFAAICCMGYESSGRSCYDYCILRMFPVCVGIW